MALRHSVCPLQSALPEPKVNLLVQPAIFPTSIYLSFITVDIIIIIQTIWVSHSVVCHLGIRLPCSHIESLHPKLLLKGPFSRQIQARNDIRLKWRTTATSLKFPIRCALVKPHKYCEGSPEFSPAAQLMDSTTQVNLFHLLFGVRWGWSVIAAPGPRWLISLRTTGCDRGRNAPCGCDLTGPWSVNVTLTKH